jgi:hypothetical protein
MENSKEQETTKDARGASELTRWLGFPVNFVERDLPAQLVFFTDDKVIEHFEGMGYEITYTFAGKLYTVLDPATKCLKQKDEIRRGLVDKAFKVIKTEKQKQEA